MKQFTLLQVLIFAVLSIVIFPTFAMKRVAIPQYTLDKKLFKVVDIFYDLHLNENEKSKVLDCAIKKIKILFNSGANSVGKGDFYGTSLGAALFSSKVVPADVRNLVLDNTTHEQLNSKHGSKALFGCLWSSDNNIQDKKSIINIYHKRGFSFKNIGLLHRLLETYGFMRNGAHKEIVSLLIDYGIDVDAIYNLYKYSTEDTPLHVIARAGFSCEISKPFVNTLLDKGADPKKKNANGFMPVLLIMNKTYYDKKFLELFRSVSCSTTLEFSDSEMCQLYFSKQDSESSGDEGYSPNDLLDPYSIYRS